MRKRLIGVLLALALVVSSVAFIPSVSAGTVTIGSQIAVVKPFLYDPNVIHFSDDFDGTALNLSLIHI